MEFFCRITYFSKEFATKKIDEKNLHRWFAEKIFYENNPSLVSIEKINKK